MFLSVADDLAPLVEKLKIAEEGKEKIEYLDRLIDLLSQNGKILFFYT